ncbi:hypothetical protein BDV34DRAFT_183961 [Aspergillus parasiticus]|uniref:Uncharacterized protein n=1 Tax=Aspergillus parasiticus TaxID=5067 RepID=A0A5N6E5J5_ASPPA|nr:hypothetical protein BDV34DRAFT_183961 [Aspergillus parasiticus]
MRTVLRAIWKTGLLPIESSHYCQTMSYLLPQQLRAAFSRLKFSSYLNLTIVWLTMRESFLIVSSFLSLSLQFDCGRVHPYHRVNFQAKLSLCLFFAAIRDATKPIKNI